MLLKICNKCGYVQKQSNFCPNCGNNLQNISCLPDQSNSAGALALNCADLYYLKKNYGESLKWYKNSAKCGNSCAKKRLELFFKIKY